MNADWGWLLLACAVALLTKLAGYLVPERWLAGPRMTRAAAMVTIGLLAALVASNAFAAGQRIVVDARLGALLAAIAALLCRVSFLGVVLAGTAAAGLLRLAGIG